MVWNFGTATLNVPFLCVKIFFNYPKYYSVTAMLLELGLHSIDTLLYNSIVW